MTSSSIQLSVVIASWPDTAGLIECLDAVEAQRAEGTEVIVAMAEPPPPELALRFARVQWLPPMPDVLIPNLWSKGMALARGKIVAITTAHFVPAPDWLAQIHAAHQRLNAAGIGGAIEPPGGGSVTDWATYFLRYSTLFELDREQTVADLAGDNASYKRAALTAYWSSIQEGFWESEFHRLLLANGSGLAFVPEIRVVQRASFGIRRFCAQRLSHGRHFGRDRMRGKSFLFRLAGIVAAPLIPFVLLAKIVRRLARRPSYLWPFLGSLPVLLLFIVSWAVGEACGYLAAASDTSPSISAGTRFTV